ncbi:MAG: thioesterase family protein [Candidatus Thiodiazotropha endolucinida]
MKKIKYTKPIYTYEIDSGQHASNIAYVQWMEVGRLKLLKDVGLPIHEIKAKGFVPAIVRTEINYKKPLFIGDEVRVVLWISELKSASANMSFKFYNQHDELVATGKQAGLFISLENQRPYRLSKNDRALFEPYVARASK